MWEAFLNRYFKQEFSSERRNFNMAGISAILVFAITTISSVLMRFSIKVILCLMMGFVISIVVLQFAEKTSAYSTCAIVMAIMINLVAIPGVFWFHGKLISGTSVYFLLGILFCVLSMKGVMMYGWVLSTILIDTIVIVRVYLNSGNAVIPQRQLNVANIFEIIFSVLFCGLLAGFTVKYKLIIYQREKERAEEQRGKSESISSSKDIFLVNMSHEIRTPMNAILGTSQLLLDSDLEDKVKENVYNILNSCNALLSTVNDLLDFSKIESGNISIEESEYDFGSLINDIVNMISVRLMDSTIEFFVNVDSSIPQMLYGDGTRIRQLFINILNNAVKYTKAGSITLTIKAENSEDGTILLKVDVADTGVGIRKEHLSKLFQMFERIEDRDDDSRQVEGTGLGLSICKEILNGMGGTIAVESTYNVGSTFSFQVPQRRVEKNSLLEIENPEQYHVLVYEDSEQKDCMVQIALRQCGISFDSVYSDVSFRSSLLTGEYTHFFISKKNYDSLEVFLDENRKKEQLVVMVNINQTNAEGRPGIILTRPLFCMNVGAVFNHTKHNLVHNMAWSGEFICPDAKIMIVDDNRTNLMVAEGILSKYQMQVVSAVSGRECLNRLMEEPVDMIFLDYMMPEMDGIDTLLNIRKMDAEWAQKIPIVALTANAVSGAREMLMDAGFNDYISKPIEMKKLERCIKKFLPEELLVSVEMKG